MQIVSPLLMLNFKQDLYVIVDTKLIDSYLGCYVIFPDTVQLPAPVEVDPQTKDDDEAGKPPQGQEPIEAGKEEQKQGNPKKFVLTKTL